MHNVQQGLFATLLKLIFQFKITVKVILDSALAAAGNKDQFGHTGGHRLLYRVLNQRLVDDGQHFLGVCLGGRQEARAHTGNGKDSLANSLCHCFLLYPVD